MEEDVGLITRDAMERAYKLRKTELRARALVDSAVAHSMRNRGNPEDSRDFAEYAHDIALNACALLVEQIYEGDAEVKVLRIERDHYKAIAERSLTLAPLQLLIKQPPENAL